jgi:hypothetical protein
MLKPMLRSLQKPSDSSKPTPKQLAIAAPPEGAAATSNAAPRAQPIGARIWKTVKPWLSPSAWMDSAYNAASKLIDATSRAAFNLAVERDATTGQLINAMPVTFPNMLDPEVNDWALPIEERGGRLVIMIFSGYRSPPSHMLQAGAQVIKAGHEG